MLAFDAHEGGTPRGGATGQKVAGKSSGDELRRRRATGYGGNDYVATNPRGMERTEMSSSIVSSPSMRAKRRRGRRWTGATAILLGVLRPERKKTRNAR